MRKGENIYKRKDGRWEGRYIKDRDLTGKVIYGYVYGKSYKEVKNKKIEMSNNKVMNKKQRFFYNELLDMWLHDHKCNIKESTYTIYFLSIEKHIKPYFIGVYIDQINDIIISKFVNFKISSGRLDGKGGLSSKSIKELLNIIKMSLSYAEKMNLIGHISINYDIPLRRNKLNMLNNKEYMILINDLKNNVSYINIGILLMMCTGLRIGELCALKNNDVNLDNKTLSISRTLQRITDVNGGKTKVIITETKTDNSIRIVPIPSTLLSYIQINSNKDNYFLTQSDKYMEPRTFRYAFKRKIKKLQLPEVTVHSLRHLFATQCIELGFDYNCLSEILGHSSPSTTMNLYVHSKIEYKQQCMNRIQI